MILLCILFMWLQPPTLTIKVENINPTKGNLMIGVFDKASFEQKKSRNAIRVVKHPANKETIEIRLELPKGKYGIKMYHDINGNGKIDFNLLGIPKEPYGFSNNAKGFMSEPSYEDAAFNINDKPVLQTIELQ